MNSPTPRFALLVLAAILVATTCPAEEKIIFECDFESERWFESWGLKAPARNTEVVTKDAAHGKKCLQIKVAKGSNYGTSLEYRFKRQTGSEPEEIYFRYYLRLGADWDPKSGGKLPGFGGTYGKAGWGGRSVNGKDGWSARGLFLPHKNGATEVGFYCYHADMKGKYGSNWKWDTALKNERWYCVEQYAKMNTPGKNDGILRAWIDGKQTFEKTDVRMRDTENLKIEMIWFNVYHGGKDPAAKDHHLLIDDVVISRERIGLRK